MGRLARAALYHFRQTAMESLLDSEQKKRYQEFKEFVAAQVEPFAERWDREQRIPDHVISMLARSGYLGSSLPPEYGGQGWDIVTFGLLHGCGFAGALSEVGLPQTAIPVALLFFNVGVEIGQLIFVAAILIVVAALRRLFTIPKEALVVPAYAIGIIAAFWVIERVGATFFGVAS